MLENNTTTMEPTTTTRKTRVRKPSAPHIVALKAAVSNALKQEWLLQKAVSNALKQELLLQKAITKHSNAIDLALAQVAFLNAKAREAWLGVHERSADCASAHLE
jgi:hypothetical protein